MEGGGGLFGLRIVEVVYDVDKLFAFNLERFYENIGILETLVTNGEITIAQGDEIGF